MSFRSFRVISVAVLILFSCSSTVEKKPQVVEKVPSKKETETIKDSAYYLQKAKTSFANNANIYQRNSFLLSAAEAFQTEEKCDKSIKMLQVLQTELQDEKMIRHANLVVAECLVMLLKNNSQGADTFLADLPTDTIYKDRVNALKAELFTRKQDWLSAANFYLKSSDFDIEKSNKVWSLLKNLNLDELEQASLRHTDLHPWLQLAIINKRFALDPAEYKQQIVNWQSRNLNEIIATNLPEEVVQMMQLEPISPSRIAVLVPLSGRLASQGLAIKKGILASYFSDLPNNVTKGYNADLLPSENGSPFKELRFFDSSLKTPEELNALVADFDVVIGPLIKDKLAGLKAILPEDKILLGLNRLDNIEAEQVSSISNLSSEAEDKRQAERYYFALAPEDEAQQLARHIYKKQLIHPVIFASESSATQRMAQAFIDEWQRHSNYTSPELITFKSNKDMREKITKALDVSQSKARIRQIEYLSNQEVFGVERNRRDIDAIILFANPNQTELLNPIIEASLSPFARQSLSVFASSRSYSIDVNQNSLRDLRNLTFTDMPWMLPDHQWDDLSAQVNELWPQEKDSLLRLFAMGVDAYNLVPHLRTLKLLSEVERHSLTGDITIDIDGVIHRRLPWAQVKQDKVTLIELD
ncbi:penicillin-binding protein activator [Paraglaciecola sp. 2405UD69-4]|uniref:penicillin-binding protein activator n=1 Tax=Paraglaciecola sp. 2405UD69-4 TaxID=3391836 RepID=UPI0039C9E969